MDDSPKISVIITVYNDAEKLNNCLAALFNTQLKDFEVIVVDDGSSEDIKAVASQFPCRFSRIGENKGQAFARNHAASLSKGEILLFTDADCIVMKDWVHAMSEKLTDAHARKPKVSALCCRLTATDGFFNQCDAYAGYAYITHGRLGPTDHFNTACAGVFRKAFDEVNGFSLDMVRNGEDVDLGLKLIEAGHEIIFDPARVVTHDAGVDSFRKFIEKHQSWGRGLVLKLEQKHTKRLGPWMPLFLNPVTHFFLIVPVALLTTVRIVSRNIPYNKKVIAYSIFILMAKLVFRWSIFTEHVKHNGQICSLETN